jgi:hypothetical protein
MMLKYIIDIINFIVDYFLYNYPNFLVKHVYSIDDKILFTLSIITDRDSVKRWHIGWYICIVYKSFKILLALFILRKIKDKKYIMALVEKITDNDKKVIAVISWFYGVFENITYNYRKLYYVLIFLVLCICYSLFFTERPRYFISCLCDSKIAQLF